MRAATIVLFSLLGYSIMSPTAGWAATSDACKQCGEQQQACRKNYSAKTCKTEYDICMKSCKQQK